MADAVALKVWTDTECVATITHEPRHDVWRLEYSQEWRGKFDNFALSPSLPVPDTQEPSLVYDAGAVKRFLENLLPEGSVLDAIAASQYISRNCVFGLLCAIGAETTGAFRFLPVDEHATSPAAWLPRPITMRELSDRIVSQQTRPLLDWDGKIHMSIAGMQQKLPVHVHEGVNGAGTYLFLPEYPLASTHILKPQPSDLEHLVINEHFCMSLARMMQLPVADTGVLRIPELALTVRRFDRQLVSSGAEETSWEHMSANDYLCQVSRRHIIDACQACDFPLSMKYERNFGRSRHVAHIREGMSLPRLFKVASRHAVAPVVTKKALVQWVLFQLLIGNYEAHGKNFSFYMTSGGLAPAPWYDLVSVAQYPTRSHEMAMAIGDAFVIKDVSALELAKFAARCDIEPGFLSREARRLCALASKTAQPLLDAMPYLPDERDFAQGIVDLVRQQAIWLMRLTERIFQVPA